VPFVPDTLLTRTAKASWKDREYDDWTHGSYIWASASAGYPFNDYAPSVDYNIEIHACELADGSVKLAMSGMHNDFPAYEIIVDKSLVFHYYPTDPGPSIRNLTMSTTFSFGVTINSHGVVENTK
jgi:hypothetical protein